MKTYFAIRNNDGRYLKIRTGSNGAKRAWVKTLKAATVFAEGQARVAMNELKNSPYFTGLTIEQVGEADSAWMVKLGKNSSTITLYLINQYEAYMADEQGIVAVRNMPTDTIDYKHELLEQADVELPTGFSIEKTQGEGEEIFKGNEAAELVTEFTGGRYVTSLVTSDGIVTLKVWNHGR